VHEHAPQLGFAPTLEVDGLADEELDARIADDVAAVVREALSNCARHARASRVAVNAQREGNLVVIEVTDDGVGIPHLDRFSGLANLRERAERHGGQLQLTVPEGGGTRLVWTTRLQSD
jgi:signal transduction histidine kinase